MIIVAGNWRCFTSWTARLIGEIGGLSITHEPFNVQWHDPKPDWPSWFGALLREKSHLLHRYPGWNEGLGDEDAAVVRELLRAMPGIYGGADVARIMHLHYWSLVREVWPGCRIVYCARRLRSWLSAIVRAPCSLKLVLGHWPGKPEWIREARHAAQGDEGRLQLYIAASYHAMRQRFNLRALREEAGDFLVSDGEHLSAQYEVEIPRLLEYCRLPVPDIDELARHRVPPKRSWRHARWSWRDVCEVAERVEAGDHADEAARA